MFQEAGSVWFATRVRLLSRRVSNILKLVQQATAQEEIERIEKELNTCSAMLEQLLDYAKCHKVMSPEDHEITKQTHLDLQKCDELLKHKKLNWWQKALAKINEILPLIGDLIGYIAAFLYERSPTAGLIVAAVNEIIGFLPARKI
jgi:hypothetical protein